MMRIILPPSSGTAGVDWQAMDLASMTGTTDPGGWLTGAVTESGGYLQIPVSTGSNQSTIAGATRLRWPMPATVNTGAPFVLLSRILFQAKPTGAYGAAVGLYDGVTGLAAGLRHKTGASVMSSFMNRGAGSSTGNNFTATALSSIGAISVMGDFDGVATLEYSGWSCVEDGGSTKTTSLGTSPAAASTFANQEIILSIPHGSTTTEAETLAVKAEYAFLELAQLT